MPWWVVEDSGAWSVEQDAATSVAQFTREFGVPPKAGPFPSYAAGNNWLTAHGHKNAAPLSGGGGGPAPPGGGGSPAPAGKWYIEYIVAGGGSGGQAVPKVVRASSPPQSGGDIEWVFGPYPSRQAAQTAADHGPPPESKMVNSRGLTDNSSAKPGQSLAGIDAVGRFFSTLGGRATWVRIIKVVVGSIMIIAGLARLGAPAAEKIAAKLPPVIPV